MKKLLFVLFVMMVSNYANAQTSNSKDIAVQNFKTLYPNATESGDHSEVVFDKTTNSFKVAPSQLGKVKILEVTDWIIINDDGSYCFGSTVVYVHVLLGMFTCPGHIVNGGVCP